MLKGFQFPTFEIHLINKFLLKVLLTGNLSHNLKYQVHVLVSPVSCELPMNHLNLISTYLYILKKWLLRVKYGG